jgi:hypothetical protein
MRLRELDAARAGMTQMLAMTSPHPCAAGLAPPLQAPRAAPKLRSTRAIMTMTAHKTAEILRLIAFDAEDLAIVSAHLQDALARVGDMAWLPEQNRFALILSRFDWMSCECGHCERAAARLHFDRVRTVRQTGVPQQTPDVVLELLAVSFEPTDSPAGRVDLMFAGGAAIRLDVECLEAHLCDLGPRWTAKSRPGHALDAGPAAGT